MSRLHRTRKRLADQLRPYADREPARADGPGTRQAAVRATRAPAVLDRVAPITLRTRRASPPATSGRNRPGRPLVQSGCATHQRLRRRRSAGRGGPVLGRRDRASPVGCGGGWRNNSRNTAVGSGHSPGSALPRWPPRPCWPRRPPAASTAWPGRWRPGPSPPPCPSLEADLVQTHDLCARGGDHQHLPVPRTNGYAIAATLRSTAGPAGPGLPPGRPGLAVRRGQRLPGRAGSSRPTWSSAGPTGTR